MDKNLQVQETEVIKVAPISRRVALVLLSGVLGPIALFPLAAVARYALPALGGIFYVLATGLITLGIIRGWRASLVLDNRGITVRNFWQSAYIPWKDIHKVHSDVMLGQIPYYVVAIYATLCIDYRNTFIRSFALAGLSPKYESAVKVVRETLQKASIEVDNQSILGQRASVKPVHNLRAAFVATARRLIRLDT